VTQGAYGEAELRGIRVVYPERRLTVAQVAAHLTAMQELWTLCVELEDGDGSRRAALDRQNTEQQIENAAQPIRIMTEHLFAALSSGHAGPSAASTAAESLEALRQVQKQLTSAKLRPLAKIAEIPWKFQLAQHLDNVAPLVADLIDRLNARQSLGAERQYAVQIIQEVRSLSAALRSDGGHSPVTNTTTLYLHYVTSAPQLDIIATVGSDEAATARAMYLFAAILREPDLLHRWLPAWLDRQVPQRGGWTRLLGATPPGRDQLDGFGQRVPVIAGELIGAPSDILVAGLGDAPADLA